MKIGLDIDGVLANFPQAFIERAAEFDLADKFPKDWTAVDSWQIASCPDAFTTVWESIGRDSAFWLSIDPMPYSNPLHFKPDCYITSRRIDGWVSQQWIAYNRFPTAEVITVSQPLDKLQHCLDRGLDLFVDDHIETVKHLRDNGVNAVLYEAPYQRGHDCLGLPTIKHLSEICPN